MLPYLDWVSAISAVIVYKTVSDYCQVLSQIWRPYHSLPTVGNLATHSSSVHAISKLLHI